MIESIQEAIKGAFTGPVTVNVLDPRNDGMHLEAVIIAEEFENMGPLQRQQMVMPHLKDHFESGLHALAMKTHTPQEISMQNIKKDLSENRIVLFMKGSKEMPMCGFSGTVVEILKQLNADFVTRNVLEDPALRANIKEYSNWPTLPQLYVDQTFVGGCDIILQLFESGELEKLITK